MGRAPALIAVIAACHGGDNVTPDAPADAAPDSPDASPECGIGYHFQGHYIDWDATASAPCAIAGATLTATYDTSRVTTTDATGAFAICLESYTPLVAIVDPTANSTCTTPPAAYTIPGVAISQPAVFFGGGEFIARSLTTARVATFYSSFGSSFDATRGHLLVHVDGTPRAVSISSPSDPAQAFDGTSWTAGATGIDVFFPNIDLTAMPSDPMTDLAVSGGAVGTGAVPLAAGSITYLAVIAN